MLLIARIAPFDKSVTGLYWLTCPPKDGRCSPHERAEDPDVHR